MKRFALIISVMLISNYCKAQDCFNNYDNKVTSLACVNAMATFEMSYKAEIASGVDHEIFSRFDGETNHVVKSWALLDREGQFFNLHQYGFLIGEQQIIIVYKILKRYSLAEYAIVIGNKPFYYGKLEILTNNNDYHISNSVSIYDNSPLKFEITLQGSNLASFKLGNLHIIRLTNQ